MKGFCVLFLHQGAHMSYLGCMGSLGGGGGGGGVFRVVVLY